MNVKWASAAIAVALVAQPAAAAAAPSATDALAPCVALQTSGADRMLTARWLFAVMAKSPHITDLATVSEQHRDQVDEQFARLMVRIVNQDCIEQVEPLAAKDIEEAFGEVGRVLGEVAMQELMNGDEVNLAIEAYAGHISEDDFLPLMSKLERDQSK